MDTSTAEAAAVGGILAGIVSFTLFAILAFVVLLIIAWWRMFTKAGEKGWKSIIPIYSSYVLFKLVWNTKNFWICLGLGVVTGLLNSLGTSFAADSNGAGGFGIFSILSLIVSIISLVWYVRLSLKTAAAYGKSTGFGVGLVLLPTIFLLILAFGSSEYVGPQE